MALGPEFDQPAGRSFQRFDDAVSRGQDRLFRVLWFAVPPQSVARNLDFQALLASRFFADMALQALYYAALIASARAGDEALQAAVIGVAFLLPGVVLGPWGGSVADAMPKRLALVVAYLTMGVLALLVPFGTGTGFVAMLMVIFLVRILHQVSQPAEAAAAPMVASHAELASANSFMSLASSTGEVTGKALLAPAVVRFWGLRPITAIAGLMFMFSALRVVKFQPDGERGARFDRSRIRRAGVSEALQWLLEEPGAFWMLLLAGMASTTNVVLGTLGPQYVKQVLEVDPAFTFYVFAPASLGVVAGLFVAPLTIRLFGERAVSVGGFTVMSAAMAAMGQVTWTSNALGWVLFLPIPVPAEVKMASALSLIVGTGITVAAAATQTYIGKYVPVPIHGRVFAILGALKDGLAIPPLLILGGIAAVTGVGLVITLAPLALLIVALGVARASRAWHGRYYQSGMLG
ncbi:MAG: MFS transporter [Dehalococcoidia bacterium]|nr:MFS transporter [Dehalococcoidia bacterium]MCA9856912.1 MFS transporter [Dehalococcoidia bacterium]MCB9483842.1 MFS transporter [Dehalococcoidia bacterium]MCB9491787.1 MFS transporter [Dehalococcoidia bacterium]